MIKKKDSLRLALAVLLVAMLLSVVACAGTPNDGEKPDTPAADTGTVRVIDQHGSPVAGVSVQLCRGDACRLPMTTDEKGTIQFPDAPDGYEALILSLPDGYTHAGDATAKFPFPAGENTLTVTVLRNSAGTN